MTLVLLASLAIGGYVVWLLARGAHTMTSPADRVRTVGCYAAYGALALAVIALPFVLSSDPVCRNVGGSEDGSISEPGETAAILAFTVAPLCAVVALLLLWRPGRPTSRGPLIAAVLVFPLAILNFVSLVGKAFSACPGFGL